MISMALAAKRVIQKDFSAIIRAIPIVKNQIFFGLERSKKKLTHILPLSTRRIDVFDAMKFRYLNDNLI